MKKPVLLTSLLLLGLLAGVATSARAVDQPRQPRLVRVQLGQGVTIEDLLRAGLDVIDVRGKTEARILEWPSDAPKLRRLGAVTEVLDERPGRTAAERSRAELRSRRALPESRPGSARIASAPPFGEGSLAGFWTTAEIKMKLDDLVANDTHDIVADKIDTLGYTLQNRPIWGLKIGKNIVGPETRPVAFYNSLTHSREPQGMQTLFFFVDDLISKYTTDPFAAYLLDKRAIYIVPLVNPDGYVWNEDYYNGSSFFGYWRKNLRDNNGNMVVEQQFDGVDLNRNFGYKWALNDTGSSAGPGDETYRGPSAVSEPETQAQVAIVTALAPKTGLSFHTHSDLLLHPWGHTMATNPHEMAFREWSDEMNRDNGYLSGPSPKVLYPVNGDFNDWCYGDTLSKPRGFTWTPEVGDYDDGFWPPPSRILPLARENVRMCYVVAAIAGPWIQTDGVTVIEGAMNAGHGTHLQVRARNQGSSGTAGPGLTGTLLSLDAGGYVMTGTTTYPDLAPLTSGNPAAPFLVALADTVTPGRMMRFEVRFTDTNGLFSRDTIAVPAGTPTVLATEDASGTLSKWMQEGTPQVWGIVSNDPEHPSRYITDSPGANYPNSTNTRLRLTTPASLNLSTGVHAYVMYDARWQFEEDWDSACIEASTDGVNYTRLTATGSTPGSGLDATTQPLNAPLYAGSRRLWKSEVADLSPFTGPTRTAIRIRFRVQADGATNYEGFSVDSVRVVLYDPAAQPAPVAVGNGVTPARLALAAPAPNPVRGFARFAFDVPRAGPVRLEILDVQGRRVQTLANATLEANRYVRGWDLRDEAGNLAAPGIYLARLVDATGGVTQRFAVIR